MKYSRPYDFSQERLLKTNDIILSVCPAAMVYGSLAVSQTGRISPASAQTS